MRKLVSTQANKPWFHKPMVKFVLWTNKKPNPIKWLGGVADEIRVSLQWL